METTSNLTEEPGSRLGNLHKVTPLSKYMAMALFLILPFVGGWFGYTLSPEKIVEVPTEKIVEVEKETPTERTVITRSADASTARFNEHKDGDYLVEEECGYPCAYRLKTGDRKVLVENLQQTYSSYTSQERIKLLSFRYLSSHSQKIYFTTGVPDTDACCDIASYDT